MSAGTIGPTARTKRQSTGPDPKTWLNGAEGFFRFLDDVQPRIVDHKRQFVPYSIPSDLIRDELTRALDGDHTTIVLNWPRRHGKTVAAVMIILWRFMTRQNQNIGMVANSKDQSIDTAFKILKTALEHTPYLKSLVHSEHILLRGAEIRYPGLNNFIQGFPSNSSALYGKRIAIGQISELHAASSDAVYQTIASATVDTEGGVCIVDSTVGSRSSPLFALYQLAERGTDPGLFYSYIHYRDLDDAIANGPEWISARHLRSRAEQMTPVEFAQQHLNRWESSNSSLFPADILDPAISPYPLDPSALAEGRNYVVGAGLDRAFGFSAHGDSTVTTCLMKTTQDDDDIYYVLASDDVRFSSSGGIKRNITDYHKRFGATRLVIEHYNSQDVGAWAGDQSWLVSETVSPTADKQSNAFTSLYHAIRENRLKIHPSFTKLKKELALFEYSLANENGQSRPRFGAPRGAHDDHVYSLAWAMYSLRDQELNPYEVPGLHCDEKGPARKLCYINGGSLVPQCAESCRTHHRIKEMHDQYLPRAGVVPLSLTDFFRAKVKNTGSHTMRR